MWVKKSNPFTNDVSFKECLKNKIKFYLSIQPSVALIKEDLHLTKPIEYKQIQDEIFYLTNENELHPSPPSRWVAIKGYENNSQDYKPSTSTSSSIPTTSKKSMLERLQVLYSCLENIPEQENRYYSYVPTKSIALLHSIPYQNNHPLIMNVTYLVLLGIILYINKRNSNDFYNVFIIIAFIIVINLLELYL